MKKKNRSKKKLKKKVKVTMILLFVVAVFVGMGLFFVTNRPMTKDNKISNYVKVNKETSLYDKYGEEVGLIDKNTIVGISDKYKDLYNISNTKYYVSSDDVTSMDNYKVKDDYSKYLDLGKEITTKDTYNLLSEDKKIIINKSDKYKIKFMDDLNYYVNLDNIYFKISKDDVDKIEDVQDGQKSSSAMSVINFNNISVDCGTTFECYSVNNVNALLDYLKDNKYFVMNTLDYINWDKGYIRLPEKSVYLISSDNSEVVNTINSKYNNMINVYNKDSGMTFVFNNKANLPGTNLSATNVYSVRNTTTLDDIKLMLERQEVADKVYEGNYATSVPVVNYHFFYDTSKNQGCTESICLEVSKFRAQLDYLRDNGYTTLTMDQFIKWYEGKIEVPEKSVLLTIDDGAYGTGFHNDNNLMPILEEYKMHAVLFLITGWWDINNYKSSYLEIQSHTFDMHNRGTCGDVQLICANYQEIMEDLGKSIQIIGNNDSFCYPFYSYDDEAIRAIKDLGFKVAFAGGSRKATRSSNRYTIPRYPIYDSTSLNEFISMVS